MAPMSRALLSVALVAAFPALAAPPAIGYAQATGYYKKETRPTLYQPLNLLDGREATAWCSPTADALSELLTFGFKDVVKVDEIRVYTGNGFDEATWLGFSKARKFALKSASGALSFSVADQRGLQAVSLNPPLHGAQYSLEILDEFPAEDPDTPVCITDIIFYSDGKPLNGPWLTQKLKYDKHRASLLGTWFGGAEGGPDHFLSFYFDGTFQAVYEPYDKNIKVRKLHGEYDPAGARMTLEIAGKGRVNAKVKSKKSDEGRSLTLDGELPDDLKMTWRDHR